MIQTSFIYLLRNNIYFYCQNYHLDNSKSKYKNKNFRHYYYFNEINVIIEPVNLLSTCF